MSDEIQVRAVTVELLRPGPAHNQLLSPLTQYLGICDDAEAGIVTQPFEHAAFLRRMKAMRYVKGQPQGDRLPVLRELGIEMGKVLGAIPRLAGSLSADPSGPDTLVHLRLVLSASELAALPFELAKVPVGPNACTESWLSLQARVPVVITRRTRNVSATGVKWPMRPRILFVAADPTEVPFAEHRDELVKAVEPFLSPGDPVLSTDGRREQFGKLLTILKNARFEEVVSECAAHSYTHVHILAHGGEDKEGEHTSFGMLLHNVDGEPVLISADRLASAFTCLVDGAIQRPAVVTLATCDSGNVGSVLVPGASIAHVLHQAGISLVVASQVPLTMDGSVLVVREFYRGLLWCENPWVLLHRIRTGLHGRLSAHSHDWASLVVYDALPADLADQLEEARYHQAKAANGASFEWIDQAALEPRQYRGLTRAMLDNLKKMAMGGRFEMECLGLRASSRKRLAQAEFRIALQCGPESQEQHMVQSALYLDQALHDYEQAVDGFLVNQGKAVQRVASLHWVLVQQLCLSAVLGKSVPDGTRETARMSAVAYLEHPDLAEQAWAHGSLAELALLEAESAPPGKGNESALKEIRNEARAHVRELARLARRLGKLFIIESTMKQFKRYTDWWGTPLFEGVVISLDLEGLRTKAPDADAAPCGATESIWQQIGLVRIAEELVVLLEERGVEPRKTAVRPVSPQAGALPVSAGKPTVAAAQASAADGESLLGAGAAPVPSAVLPQARPSGKASTAQKPTRPTQPAPGGTAFFNIEMLPAGHGDCLWIEYGRGARTSRVLVDCGTTATYGKALKGRIERQKVSDGGCAFELFILSHIDADHIGGAIPLLQEAKSLGVSFDDVWFNGWKHLRAGLLGARQGEQFSALIQQNGLTWNGWQAGQAIALSGDGLPRCTLPGGMVLTLLSPTPTKLKDLAETWEDAIEALNLTPGKAADFAVLGKTPSASKDVPALADADFSSDTATPNGSSIAVLAEYEGKSALLASDAHAPLLVASIKRLLGQGGGKLKVDAFKLPHHGSQNNLNRELMQLLDCSHYLVSSNGSHFNHPDREAIGRVIRYGGNQPTLHFNYESKLNEVWKEAEMQRKYSYTAVYPQAGQQGLTVRL